MQELVDVNNLLKDEVSQANLFMKRAREVLEPIYMSAANKLIQNDLVADQSEVCSRLCKIFGAEHERQLQRWLPEKYKRTYVKDESKDTPRTPEEEYLKLMSDVLSSMNEAINTLYRKVREEPLNTPKHEGLTKIIADQFPTLSDLKLRIDELKNISIDLAHAKELQDERQKIGDYEKVMLKIQLLFINKDHVAKMIDFSSKWIKNGVEKDEELLKALEIIRKCPFCQVDIAEWYNKQVIRRNKGLELQVPPMYAHLS